MAKFFGKNPNKKYVRQIANSRVSNPYSYTSASSNVVKPVVEKVVEEVPVKEKEVEVVEVVETVENKEVKNNTEMADEKLEKIEAIVGAKAPKRKVKVEKKDKGLFERTDDSVILLTEDNKMLLND